MLILSKDLKTLETYKLLTGVVVPRPIAWVSTLSKDGVTNLAPFSCFTFVSNKPPLLGINIGQLNRKRKDTAVNMAETGEFVVNIGNDSQIEPLHNSAEEYPPEVSEIDVLGLHTLPSQFIHAPRLAEAPIQMECKLHSITPFGEGGSEFFVGEVLAFHIADDVISNGKVDTAKLRPICRLAGPNYAKLGEIIAV